MLIAGRLADVRIKIDALLHLLQQTDKEIPETQFEDTIITVSLLLDTTLNRRKNG